MHASHLNVNSNTSYRRIISQQTEYKSSKLFDEIAILMRAFGDCCDVNMQIKESVILVEKILIQQLKTLIDMALDVNPSPQMTDFEFLLHRNKPKLIRFRKHMRHVRKIQYKNEQKQQQQRFDSNFLNKITSEDSDEEEQEMYDAEKIRRIYRADRISQILSPQKYEEFQKARSYTSNLRNKMNFLNKLIEALSVPKEVQENPNFLDIILFFAQETIATLIDFSILTRLTSDNRINDPVIVPSNLSNDIVLCPEVTQGRGQEGIKPIKVQEIQEAIRRVQQMHNHRNISSSKIAFLAL